MALAAKTILIVEDDDATREGFGMVLSEHGYKVGLASTGQHALDYLQANGPPDLIVLDMLMQGIDGWQFLKRRDKKWRQVPILIATALSVASKEWAVAMGAAGLLQKPIDLTVLVERVGKLLGSDQGIRAS